MRPQSIVLALALSLAPAVAAGANSGAPSAPSGKTYEERYVRKKPFDCHRDVRTHRIGGAMVTHRHVGDRCQIRQVRQAN